MYNGRDYGHMVSGFSRQCNKSSLLMKCPSPGEDIFVGEECVAQVGGIVDLIVVERRRDELNQISSLASLNERPHSQFERHIYVI